VTGAKCLFFFVILLGACGSSAPSDEGGAPRERQSEGGKAMNATPEQAGDPSWIPSAYRRLGTGEIRELITGSAVIYETVLLGNRPMVEKFYPGGRSEKFGPRAAIPGRYEIKNDELCIHYQIGAAPGTTECRRLFGNKDGQVFVWFLRSTSKGLRPIIVKPLN
jgi:hypothetical protein